MKKILSLFTAAALMLGTTTAFAQENGEPPGTAAVTSTTEVSNAPETESYSINTDLNNWDNWVQIPAEVFKDVTTDTVVTINCDAYTAEKDNWWYVKFCRIDLGESVCIDDLKIEDDVMYFTGSDGGYALDQGTSKISFRFSDKETFVNGETVCSSLEAVKQSGLGICGYHVMLRDMTFETRPATDNVSVDGKYLKFTELDDHTLEVTGSESATLQEIEIPAVFNGKKVTSIGERAFEKRRQLTKVTIPDSVTKIGELAFNECRNLTSVNIPDNIKRIEGWSFRNCVKLSSINLPDSLEYIGHYAFLCCNLPSVKIPKNVNGIGNGAFGACASLTEIIVDKGNTNFRAENGVLFNIDKTVLVHYPTGNKSKSYIIPDGVKSIAAAAFETSTNLTSVTIPDSIEEIGDYAFECCSGLTSVKIPNCVKVIPHGTFNYCPSMKYVTIPASVKTIEVIAFDGCINIADIYYNGSEEDWSNINIAEGNAPLANAAIHYNSTGPTNTPVEVTVKAPEGVNISDQTATVTVNGETKPLTIADGMLDVSGLADGKYTFTFKANNCAPRAYDVTVSGGAATGLESGVKLNLFGDINGDGSISLGDVLKANASARNSKPLTGYDKSVADINEDGKISLGDVLKMNAHARNSKLLW